MNRLLHFAGLRRSGNHAIINWLKQNVNPEGSEFLHYNNVYSTRIPLSLQDIQDDVHKNTNENLFVILSYEDVSLQIIPTLPTVVDQDSILKKEERDTKTMILLRDPFNSFASRLELLRRYERENIMSSIRNVPWQEVQELWKGYAKEYLGQTSLLSNKVLVNFNQWNKDKAYRDELLKTHFGQEINNDIGRNTLSRDGGGSSKDLQSYDGRASEMKLEERWVDFVQDKEYRRLLDKETFVLSEQIFGHIPGTEILLNNGLSPEGYPKNKERK